MEGLLSSASWLRMVSEALEAPTHVLLLASAALGLLEVGMYLHERMGSALRHLAPRVLLDHGRTRIDRADLLARAGPMLGLMGTLIPLGPGLSALGRGDVATLAAAVTVAFDTTVLGLAVGIVGFVLGRARRRLYDRLLDAQEPAVRADSEPEPALEVARAAVE